MVGPIAGWARDLRVGSQEATKPTTPIIYSQIEERSTKCRPVKQRRPSSPNHVHDRATGPLGPTAMPPPWAGVLHLPEAPAAPALGGSTSHPPRSSCCDCHHVPGDVFHDRLPGHGAAGQACKSISSPRPARPASPTPAPRSLDIVPGANPDDRCPSKRVRPKTTLGGTLGPPLGARLRPDSRLRSTRRAPMLGIAAASDRFPAASRRRRSPARQQRPGGSAQVR